MSDDQEANEERPCLHCEIVELGRVLINPWGNVRSRHQ